MTINKSALVSIIALEYMKGIKKYTKTKKTREIP